MAKPEQASMPRCVDCGFLTMRNLRTRELGEVDEEYRRTGNVPRHKELVVGGPSNRAADIDVDTFRFVPICFAGAARLADEIDPTALGRKEYKDFTTGLIGDTLKRDRPECRASSSFTPYHAGLTPKEHREMLDRQCKIDREDRRRKDDRNWHIKEAISLVILAGVFAIIGGYISRSSDTLDTSPLATAIALQVATDVPAPTATATYTPSPTPVVATPAPQSTPDTGDSSIQ